MAELTRRLAAADEETARIKKEANSRKASRPASREEAVAPPSPQKTKRSVLGKLDIDEASDKSIGQQLKEALRANSGRVIDLFREWDTDGDGKISKKEFRKAMPMLGFYVPVADIDKLFDANDPDGSGEMDFKELKQMLKSRTVTTPSEEKARNVVAVVKAANAFKKVAAGGDKKATTGASAAQKALSGLKKKA